MSLWHVAQKRKHIATSSKREIKESQRDIKKCLSDWESDNEKLWHVKWRWWNWIFFFVVFVWKQQSRFVQIESDSVNRVSVELCRTSFRSVSNNADGILKCSLLSCMESNIKSFPNNLFKLDATINWQLGIDIIKIYSDKQSLLAVNY